MKLRVVALFAVVFFIAVGLPNNTVAQGKEISSEEFDRIKTVAEKFFERTPYRVKSSHESFSESDSKPYKTSVWITEYVRPGRERNLYGLGSSEPTDKYERIRVGNEIFIKRDGKWKKLDYSGNSNPPPNARAESSIYKFLGTEKLNGVEVKTYEAIYSHRFWIGATEKHSIYRQKFWVNSNGHILKTVGESDGVGATRGRTTELYEYDPRITIETPTTETS